jgi:DNA-binding SARP family transcriptional activator
VEVALLGPLEVAGPGGRARVGGAKERLVLALLVLRAGVVVSRDALVDALWGDAPPATAVKTLQGYIARVRRALEAAGLPDSLATREPGYVLQMRSDSTDVAAFERHATAGHSALADSDAPRAAAELGKALKLWRGDALADCRGGGWAAAEALRLDELRLSTIEDRIDADLMLGDHGVLVGELESWVLREPLRERFWGQLMMALYRAGRQADALRVYQRARDVLIEQLGLEPGLDLRRLEAAVLARDPALDAPEALHRASSSDLAIPLPRRVEAALSAVFVGRAHEREGLNRLLKSAATGERRMVLVSGEPGIGKTALSAAFARDAFESDAIVLYGRCDEDLGIPYQPWAEVLAHLVEHLSDDVIAAHVEARGSALARLAPDLAPRPTAGRLSSDDVESERFLLFGAVVDVLARVSALAPTVLVLDDLHWADSPTIQLLRYVASADAPLRMLVIGTFRDSDLGADHPLAGALAALHREAGIERVALSGLGDDELLTLLEATAGHAIADDGVALRDALMDETDGNPFFVGEMLRHLAESGLVYQDERGRLVASSDLRTSGLPVSVREVIGRRVARLGAQTQSALTLAAVIGRDFDAEVLSVVAELEEDTLIDLCDQAVTAQLLTGTDVAGRYSFRHALIEHVLYDDLSAGRRARGHRAVAEALEEICGDDPTERIGELAYHWAHAQPLDVDKAIFYAQRAGDRALAQLAPDAARRWYRDALDLLDRASTDDAGRRAALMLGLGDAQRQSGDPTHREILLAAGRLADDIDAVDILVRAALRNNRGWHSISGAVDRERVDMLTRALERLGTADSPDRARLLAMLCAEVTWDTDFEQRLAMATEAVEIARRSGDNAALVDAIRLSHESITMPHTLELRRSWNTEACELADELSDPIARLHANDWRFSSALEAGDLMTVKTASAIFESDSEQIGQPLNRWQIAYHRACERMLEGDLDVAEQLAVDALTLGTTAGYPDDAMTIFGGQLFTLRWMQGRLSEVVPVVEQAVNDNPLLQIFRATLAFAKSLDDARDEVHQLLDAEVAQDSPGLADPTWLVAQVNWASAAARTRHRPASTMLHQRLLPWHDQFATTQVTVNGSVAHYLGLLSQSLDRYDEADRWFRQALALHEAMEAPFFVAATQSAQADLLVQRDQPGDGDRAQTLLDTAVSVAVKRGFGAVERDALSILARVSA